MRYRRWIVLATVLLWLLPAATHAQQDPVSITDNVTYADLGEDAFDDESKVAIIITAEAADTWRDGALMLICTGSAADGWKLRVGIYGDEYFGLRGKSRVRWKFGEDGEVHKERWVRKSRIATSDDPEAEDFLRAAIRGDLIAVGVRDYEGVEHTYEFAPRSVAEAVEKGFLCATRSQS